MKILNELNLLEKLNPLPVLHAIGCPRIVTRAEWGARAPTSTSAITRPVPRYFVHHSAGNTCTTQTACMAEVRAIQNLHMNSNGKPTVLLYYYYYFLRLPLPR